MQIDIKINVDEIDDLYKQLDIDLIDQRATTKKLRHDSYVAANVLWNSEDIEFMLRVEEDEFFGWVMLRRGDIE